MKENIKAYKELLDRQVEETNNSPIFWAFDNDQFEKYSRKYFEKYPEAKGKKLYSFGYGGYAIKEHCDQIMEMIDRHEKERLKAYEDDDVLEYAFEYEMGNREFIFTFDYDEVSDVVLSKPYDELTERELKIFKIAKKNYLADMEKQGY